MIFRSLGKTSLKVSEIGLGLSQFSQTKKGLHGYKTEKEIFSIIKYAIKKRINLFDTSDDHSYGNTQKILGKLEQKDKDKHVITHAIYNYIMEKL